MIVYSFYISFIYALGHYIAAKNGKIALSSDGLAIPLTALAGIIYSVISWYLGYFPSNPTEFTKTISDTIPAFSLSYLGAHLFLLLIGLSLDKIMEFKK